MTLRTPITLHQLIFSLPDGKTLFNNLTLAFSERKTGLVGKNGMGKSTLLRLLTGELYPNSGSFHIEGSLAYVPQNGDSFTAAKVTVAELLGFDKKIQALQRIYRGNVEPQDLIDLDEDWQVEERLQQQLKLFDLPHLTPNTPLHQLSGGEVTRLRLTKAFFSHVDILLLDEPTNHLDSEGKRQLYQAIQNWQGSMIIATHDRELLNLMEAMVELNTLGVFCYGGNYTHYVEQKSIQQAAYQHALDDAKKLQQKTARTIQDSREKHEQKQSYGRKLRETRRVDKLTANAKKGRSERTQNKLAIKQERLNWQSETILQAAKANVEVNDEIRVQLPATKVPQGKLMLQLEEITFAYPNSKKPLIDHFNLQLVGPKRVALAGRNGGGKTTLVNLILGRLKPNSGKIYRGTNQICYLDQEANVLNPELSLLENFTALNPEIKISEAYRSLARFLFKNTTTDKLVKHLSGGEKLRAVLACVFMTKKPPQLLILDEPTNHLDIPSILHIESALKNYQGAMIVVSHDQTFLNHVGIEQIFYAPFIN